LPINVNLIAQQRLEKRNAMAGAGPAVHWRNNHYAAQLGQLFVNGRQAWRENTIIVGQ
jgi:hypothetical protein